jgi:hypothetical protein
VKLRSRGEHKSQVPLVRVANFPFNIKAFNIRYTYLLLSIIILTFFSKQIGAKSLPRLVSSSGQLIGFPTPSYINRSAHYKDSRFKLTQTHTNKCKLELEVFSQK